MRGIARIIGFVFATGTLVFVAAAAILAGVIWKYEQDLPDYTLLKNYEPPVMTRVHAADGSLLAEYSRERRLYLPSDEIPDLVKHAFISAEDKNFYNHWGVDPEGIVRAGMVYMQGSRHIQGASTITQQVAKNFLLNSDRTFDRKIREILLSLRIESAYSKEKILELYLNEIYLGLSNYGVAAAALNYFNKSVIPEVSGACIAMDPFTGRVLAMVGGFSYDESEFNRATQAQRQPGSSLRSQSRTAAANCGNRTTSRAPR